MYQRGPHDSPSTMFARVMRYPASKLGCTNKLASRLLNLPSATGF